MGDILFEYELNPTTWAYLSALLTIGIYFKFHRFWSIRNLDLLALIFFSPGLLLVYHGLRKDPKADLDLVEFGYVWLFSVGVFFTIRLILDPLMVRRPLLEPNLSAGGLVFTGAAILVFLVASLVASRAPDRLEYVLPKEDVAAIRSPGYPNFYFFASYRTRPDSPVAKYTQPAWEKAHPDWKYPIPAIQIFLARTTIIVSYLLMAAGIVLIGYRHFDNIHTGVAAASLYLLLPYTGQMTGRLDHVVPATVLVWTVTAYRRPVFAGLLMGLAGQLIFYPLFLLPLWCSFYWRRGLSRFLIGVGTSLVLGIILMLFLADSPASFFAQLRQTYGGTLFSKEGVAGFWQFFQPTYRIPVFAAFLVLSGSLALWPAQKNLGTLLSCSATLMLFAQFWHQYEGGLYMAWYLPLLVLTIFRPNLEDRVALSAVIEGRVTWLGRLLARRMRLPG